MVKQPAAVGISRGVLPEGTTAVPDIVFTTRLTEADWDDTLRGWRCPPMAVPGAVVDAVYIDGSRTDSGRYEVLKEQAVIR